MTRPWAGGMTRLPPPCPSFLGVPPLPSGVSIAAGPCQAHCRTTGTSLSEDSVATNCRASAPPGTGGLRDSDSGSCEPPGAAAPGRTPSLQPWPPIPPAPLGMCMAKHESPGEHVPPPWGHRGCVRPLGNPQHLLTPPATCSCKQSPLPHRGWDWGAPAPQKGGAPLPWVSPCQPSL